MPYTAEDADHIPYGFSSHALMFTASRNGEDAAKALALSSGSRELVWINREKGVFQFRDGLRYYQVRATTGGWTIHMDEGK